MAEKKLKYKTRASWAPDYYEVVHRTSAGIVGLDAERLTECQARAIAYLLNKIEDRAPYARSVRVWLDGRES